MTNLWLVGLVMALDESSPRGLVVGLVVVGVVHMVPAVVGAVWLVVVAAVLLLAAVGAQLGLVVEGCTVWIVGFA